MAELDPLVCRECGKRSKSIGGLHKHIRGKHGMSAWDYVQKYPSVLQARIEAIVEQVHVREHLSPCWISSGRKCGNGYTQLRVAGAPTNMTHKLAVWAWTGVMPPEGSVVLHACDTPACCNPEHLTVGTHEENMADRGAKQRQVHGTDCHSAVLDADAVRALRLRRTWGWTMKALAEHFGISKAQTERVVYGQAWTHIEPHPEDDGDFIPW